VPYHSLMDQSKSTPAMTKLLSLLLTSVFMLFASGVFTPVKAEGLEVTKFIDEDLTEIDSGRIFTYRFTYQCSVSGTGDCTGAKITDALPDVLDDPVEIIDSPDVQSHSYDSGTKTITWDFGTLAAGSTGEVRARVRFTAGATADGTVATNEATGTSTGFPDNTSDPVSITANAVPNHDTTKTMVSGGALDYETRFRIRVELVGGTTGNLYLQNVNLNDVLPAGITFVSASDGGTYDSGTHTVTWPAFDLNGVRADRYVTVIFPSSEFSEGVDYTNSASITGTPVGTAADSYSDSYDLVFQLEPANPDISPYKSSNAYGGKASVGQEVRYYLRARNTGNVPLDPFSFEDVIPVEINATRIRVDTGVTGYYQTNADSSWTQVPGTPHTSDRTVNVYGSGINLPSDEYITAFRWVYDDGLPIAYSRSSDNRFYGRILAVDRNGNAVNEDDVIQNTVTYSYNDADGNPVTEEASRNVTVTAPRAIPRVRKALTTDSDSTVNPGDTVKYHLYAQNDYRAMLDINGYTMYDLIDNAYEYVGYTVDSSDPAPTMTLTPNYNGTGKTRIAWTYTDAMPPNSSWGVVLELKVKDGTPQGSIGNSAVVIPTDMTGVILNNCQSRPADTDDLDGDSDTAELVCSSSITNIDVRTTAIMKSIKWVKGQKDTDWSKSPDHGTAHQAIRAVRCTVSTAVVTIRTGVLFRRQISQRCSH